MNELLQQLYGRYAPDEYNQETLNYIAENYTDPEDFVKDFYAKHAPGVLDDEKMDYIRSKYLRRPLSSYANPVDQTDESPEIKTTGIPNVSLGEFTKMAENTKFIGGHFKNLFSLQGFENALQVKLKNSNLIVEEAVPGSDAIKIINPETKQSKIFNLDFDLNRADSDEAIKSIYNQIAQFYKTNQLSDEWLKSEEGQIYNLNRTLPENYQQLSQREQIDLPSGTPVLAPISTSYKTPLGSLDTTKQLELLKEIETHTREVVNNPSLVPGIDYKASGDNLATEEDETQFGIQEHNYKPEEINKINDYIYGEVSKKFPSLDKYSFIDQLKGNLKFDSIKQQELDRVKKEKYTNTLLELFPDGDLQDLKIHELTGKNDYVEELWETVDKDVRSDIKDLYNLDFHIEESIEAIKKNEDPKNANVLQAKYDASVEQADAIRDKLINSGKLEKWYGDYFTSSGYSEKTIQHATDFALTLDKTPPSEMSQRDYLKLQLLDNTRSAEELRLAREEKKIRFNFENVGNFDRDENGKILNTKYNKKKRGFGFIKALEEHMGLGQLKNKKSHNYLISYETLVNKVGFDYKNFDNFIDPWRQYVVNKDDINWMRVHSNAKANNEVERAVLFNASMLNKPVTSYKKPEGFWSNLANIPRASTKMIASEWLHMNPVDADKATRAWRSTEQSGRFLIDETQKMFSTYNTINEEGILEGKVSPLEFTDDEVNYMNRSMGENLSDHLGGFIPIAVQLGAITLATEGIGTIPAVARGMAMLRGAAQGSRWGKLGWHAGAMLFEEAKMQFAGFKPGAGAAFYGIGAGTQWFNLPLLMPFAKKYAKLFDPVFQRVLKTGPVGAIAMETASLTELFIDDLEGNKDFMNEFNELFGDHDEVQKRFLMNMVVFNVMGASGYIHPTKGATRRKTELLYPIQGGASINAMINEMKAKQKDMWKGVDVSKLSMQEKMAILSRATVGREGGASTAFTRKLLFNETKNGLNEKIFEKVDNVLVETNKPHGWELLDAKQQSKWKALEEVIQTAERFQRARENYFETVPPKEFLNVDGKVVKDPRYEQKFEKWKQNVDKRVFIPFREILKRSNPKGKFVDFEVEYTKDRNRFSATDNKAEWIEGENKILIDINKIKPGVKIHEIVHIALSSYLKGNQNVKANFNANFQKLFEGQNFRLKNGKKLSDAIKEKYEYDLRKPKDREAFNEEYFAHVVEQLANPNFYYKHTAPTLIKEIVQDFKHVLEENFGIYWKPKKASELVDMLGRLSYGMARGRDINIKLSKLMELDKIGLLDIQFGKLPAAKKSASKELVSLNSKLSEQLKKARKEGNEREINRIENELFMNNRGIIQNFINTRFHEGMGITREEFESNVNFEVLDKINKTYLKNPKDAYAEYGAYVKLMLEGGGGFGGGRMGAILRRTQEGYLEGSRSLDQPINTEGMTLGETIVAETITIPQQYKKAAESKKITLTNDLTVGGSKAIKSNEVKDIENNIKDNLSVDNILNLSYKNIPESTVAIIDKISGKNRKEREAFARENWVEFLASLSRFNNNAHGKSVGMANSIIEAFYNPLKGTASGKDRGAGKATGDKAGNPWQELRENLGEKNVMDYLMFDKKPGEKGYTTAANRWKMYKKVLAKRLYDQTLRSLEQRGELPTDVSNALKKHNVIAEFLSTKQQSMASKELMDQLSDVHGVKLKEGEYLQIIHTWANGGKLTPIYNSIIEDYARSEASIISDRGKVEGLAYTTAATSYLKSKGLLPAKSLTEMSIKDFQKQVPTNGPVYKRFLKLSLDLAKNLNVINSERTTAQNKKLTRMMMDFMGNHVRVLGKGFDKVTDPHQRKVLEMLVEETQSKLSEKQQEINKNLTPPRDSYSFASALQKLYFPKNKTEAFKIIKKEFSKQNIKDLQNVYDAFQKTLAEWVNMKGLSKAQKAERADFAGFLKKINSYMGVAGDRAFAPIGWLRVGKSLKQWENKFNKDNKILWNQITGQFRRKYEHLKASNNQSLEALKAIVENNYNSKVINKGYSGIHGFRGEFDIVDGKTGKLNTSGIFRFAENIQLAKQIYSVQSIIEGKPRTLYQEMMLQVGKTKLLEAVKNSKSRKSRLYNEIKNKKSYASKDLENSELSKILQDRAQSVANARDLNAKKKGASILDFDETVAFTKSKIKYEIPRRLPDGRFNWRVVGWGAMPAKGKLTPAEFAKRHMELEQAGAIFDFKEFTKVIGGKKGPLFKKLEKIQAKYGTEHTFILTARPQESAPAIQRFLMEMGVKIPLKNIRGLEDGRPGAKANFIVEKTAEGYNDFYFVDDMIKNVKAVREVIDLLGVNGKIRQARVQASKNLEKDFNKILEETTGVEVFKKFSVGAAKARGSQKGKWSWWLPPSAQGFLDLMYPTFGKGKTGNKHMKWFDEVLGKPYARGFYELNKAKQRIDNDYQALKKQFPEIKKIINKDSGYRGFTNDVAIRTYLWNKAGFKIPDLSKTDISGLVKLVESNSGLKNYANKISEITQLKEGYIKPSESWLAKSIQHDLLEISNNIGRKQFFKEWIENKNAIFTKATLNKLEALYGSNYRAALTDMLYRMETGQNKIEGTSSAENMFSKWIGNATGTIMFLNRRSALTQTISMLNFMNWRENNPLAIGKAFANQPQFWKDFSMIWNSPMLKQRRKGLSMDVNYEEIVNTVAGKKDKVSAAVAYMLNKGFVLTKLADNFAIAFGGSSFYRNRLNRYLKQGLSEKQAKEKAFVDFQEASEPTQQSARPDLISQQQASPLGRFVLAFQNVSLQNNRNMKRAILDLKNKRGDMKTNISKIVYYGAIQNIIFLGMQQALFAAYWDDDATEKDVDKKWMKIGNGMLDIFLRGSGVIGVGLSTLKNTIFKYMEESEKGWKGSEAKVLIEALNISPPVGSKIRKIHNAMIERKFNDDSIVKPSLLALEGATNVPFHEFYQMIEDVESLTNEQLEAWQKLAVVLGYPEWQVDIAMKELEKIDTKKRGKKAVVFRSIN